MDALDVTSRSVNLSKTGMYTYMLLFITYQVTNLQDSHYYLDYHKLSYYAKLEVSKWNIALLFHCFPSQPVILEILLAI